MITLGEVRTFLLIAMSFLVFQIVHKAPAQIKSVTLCLAPRQSSTNFNMKFLQLVRELCQPKETLRKVQRYTTIGHWKRIWSVVSRISHAAHFSGPDYCFFLSWTPDWILSWAAIQMKIFTFKGILHFHTCIICWSLTPPKVIYLYREPVEYFLDCSRAQYTLSLPSSKVTSFNISCNWSHSSTSTPWSFLLSWMFHWPSV